MPLLSLPDGSLFLATHVSLEPFKNDRIEVKVKGGDGFTIKIRRGSRKERDLMLAELRVEQQRLLMR